MTCHYTDSVLDLAHGCSGPSVQTATTTTPRLLPPSQDCHPLSTHLKLLEPRAICTHCPKAFWSVQQAFKMYFCFLLKNRKYSSTACQMLHNAFRGLRGPSRRAPGPCDSLDLPFRYPSVPTQAKLIPEIAWPLATLNGDKPMTMYTAAVHQVKQLVLLD